MSNRNTVTNVVLTLAFVLLPQLASAQTNTFPSSGNAGIGTTSPGDALQIVKDNGGLTLDTATSGTIVPVFRFSTTGIGRASIQYRPDLPGLAFQTGGVAYPAQSRMVLTDSGNLGIGTTSPLGRFHLVAPSYTDTSIPAWDNHFLVVGAGSNTGGISLSYNQTTNTGYLMSLSPNVAWRNTVIQPFGGHVGIGTPTPGFGGLTSSTYLTLAASGSNRPAFEFVSNLSDGVGKEAGFLEFVFNTNSSGHKRIGNISVDTEGATANQRGGVMRFFTKPNASATMLERMRIDSGGNVGVGTTTPGYKLDVAGEIRSSSGGFRFPDGSLQTTAATGGGGGSQWSGTGPIYYTGGNVGIGTDSPTTKLHVSAGDSSFALFGPNSTWGGSLAVGSGAAFVSPISGRAQVLSSNGNLHLDGGTGQNVYLSWLTPTNTIINGQGGNVGIGTSSPSDLLQIDSASGWGFRIRYTGSGDYLRMSSNQISAFTSGGTGKDLYLNTAGGNVGIGTINPIYSLDVNGGVNGFRAKAATASSTDAIATFENSSGVQAIVRGNGYIGIGNTSPTEKLHVTGNGKFTGNLTVDGTINAKYQDLAEWVPSSEQLVAGTVVVLDTTKANQVISSGTAYDTRVAGVISAQPGITLGESGEGKVLVATTGRVRVKVDASRGPIQIGDLLVTSDVSGVAMKSEPVEFAGRKMHMPGTIIGKALEPLAKGSGEILVLLSLQ